MFQVIINKTLSQKWLAQVLKVLFKKVCSSFPNSLHMSGLGNLHYIIYYLLMKHDGVFWFTCQVISKNLDYLWLLQLGRLINNRATSVSGNREQTFYFCLIPVHLMLFSLEFKPIRLLFQPAHESRNGFIMEITIFWFQKGHVVQSGMLLRLQPRRGSLHRITLHGVCFH